MGHRNGIFAVLALALSSVALAGMVYTDAYSHAAQAEASGYYALTSEVGNGAVLLCSNDEQVLPANVEAQNGKAVTQ